MVPRLVSIPVHVLATVAALFIPRAHCFSIQAWSHHRASPLLLSQQANLDGDGDDARKAASASSDILAALRTRTGGDLEVDFYDTSTHLYSEGVWHNALAGITSLKFNKLVDDQDGIPAARRIAESLYKYSWDGSSFRRRVWSGSWDHSRLDSDHDNPPEQANYYRESNEHRCVQHGMALIFWSELLLAVDDSTDSSSSKTTKEEQEQQEKIATAFINEFWNGEQWTTVSKSQGGGSTLRRSASAAKPTLNASNDDMPYYRAVDQAIAVLALLAHIKVLETKRGENAEDLIRIVQMTCQNLLAPTNTTGGFGYGTVATARAYIGLDRNRNFWHDGWILLAISCARKYLWPSDSSHGETQLQAMMQGLLNLYGHNDNKGNTSSTSSTTLFDGTIWHWPKLLKDDESNVRYCGDNALLYAISRTICSEDERTTEGFWKFIGELRDKNDDGLASVADAYPQVRLHPNTELAALLLWPNRSNP
jgi:hypothetical protein